MRNDSNRWPQLKIRLAEIPSDGLSLTESLDAVWLRDALGEQEGSLYRACETPVQIEARLHVEAEGVRVTGRICFEVAFDCGYCLEELREEHETLFDHLFMPVERYAEDGRSQRELEEDLEIFLYADDVLLLEDMLLQETLLALPMNPSPPFDDDGCCQACGQRRERFVVRNEPQTVASPWEKLKELDLKKH